MSIMALKTITLLIMVGMKGVYLAHFHHISLGSFQGICLLRLLKKAWLSSLSCIRIDKHSYVSS